MLISALTVRLSVCERASFSGTAMEYSCELLCGCWELNLSPLEEQPVFLTVEPSLEPGLQIFK